MQSSYISLYVMLLSLPIIPATLLSMLPETSTNQWETAASSIIHRYINLLHDVQIICESTCVSDQFLKNVPIPIQNSRYLHENTLVVIIVQSRPFVASVLNSAANSTKSKLVIFVHCYKCVTIPWILEQCWHRKLLNVVVIPIKNKVLPVYTYLPFREGTCFDTSPVLIDNFATSFVLNVELFPKHKVWNLHNCTLKVSSFNLDPVIHFEDTQMKGLYAPIFYAVVNSMNFNPQLTLTEKWFGFVAGRNEAFGLRGDVYSRRAHLGFSLFSPLDLDYLDYDSLPMTGCVTWCCPGGFKKKPLLWHVIGEFSTTVWTMLLLAFMGTVATDFVLRKLSPRGWLKASAPMYMIAWGALLQGSGGKPSYFSTPLRAFWTSWLLLSAVLPTVYLSTMKSFQAAPYMTYSPSNFEELADAGLQAWFHKGQGKMMNAMSENNAVVAKLKSNSFVYPPDMYGTMIHRLRYKNITSLLEINICKIYSAMYANEFNLYPLPDACMQMSSAHLFVMAKGSAFTDAVASRMMRLTQAGIIQRTWSGNNTLSRKYEKKTKTFSLEAMLPSFLVLACGWLVGSVTFIFEWLWIRYSLSQKIRIKISQFYVQQ